MAVYSHCPLLNSDSIRLVILHPGPPTQRDIYCELLSISLSSIPTDDTASYTTLSYAWGKPEQSKVIFIHGERFEVGRNLYSALQNFRREDRSIRLWVDAICINQKDSNERNQQVQQMRAIYASSSETVIYLGPDDRTAACASAWNFLEFRSSWAMNSQRDPDRLLPTARQKDVNFKTGYNDVLNAVMSREWFTRIWIIQEVVVSQELSIQCEQRRIPWDDFCRTLFLYFRPLQGTQDDLTETSGYSQALDSLRTLTMDNDITDIRPGWELVARTNPRWKDIIQPVKELCQTRILYQRAHRHDKTSIPDWVLNNPLAEFVTDDTEFRRGSLRLAHLLAKSRKFNATDPRDKALALLGISAGLSSADVESLVDYNKTDQQIYRDVTRFILDVENAFDILSQVGQTALKNDLSFSSWAGKWNEVNFPPISALSRLGGEPAELTDLRRKLVSEHHTWSADGEILACTGGIMGELVAMGPLDLPPSEGSEKLIEHEWLKRHMDLANNFAHFAEALLQSSIWSFDPKNVHFNATTTVEGRGKGHFHVKVQTDEQNPTVQKHFIAGGYGFLDDVFALQQGRMLGVVRSASRSRPRTMQDEEATYSWCVVPESAEVGDRVATITGCRVLFLVYPHSADEGVKGAGKWKEMEDSVRKRLSPDGEKEAEIVHCRLRGECRVSGFEDMWEPWKMEEKCPVMTYAGYHPREWQSAIFAFH